jgi:hypothetical protein
MNTIERSALGRIAKLGDLYDARTDSFCGFSMLTGAPPLSAVTLTDNFSNRTDVIYTETLEEKGTALNIAAELQVSILCLRIEASGAAKYMQEHKTSAKSVRTTMVCDVTTKFEQLEMFYDELRGLISTEVFEDGNATHVVVGIQWGGNAYVSVELQDAYDCDGKSIDGQLAVQMNAIIANIRGGGKGSYSDNKTDLTKQVTFKMYGDVLPSLSDDIPVTFEDACQQVKCLRERIADANNGKGKPIKYVLFPLTNELFKKHLRFTYEVASTYKQIEDSALKQFVELFDNILHVRQQVNDLMADVENCRSCLTVDVIQGVQRLKGDLDAGEALLKAQLADALTAVRAGQAEISRLFEVKANYLKSDMSYVEIKAKCETQFTEAQKKLAFAGACVRYGIKYLNGSTPIDKELVLNDEVYVLYASDELCQNDPHAWDANRFAFFNLAKALSSRTTSAMLAMPTALAVDPNAKTSLIFLDCSFNPELARKEGIRIKHFRNNILVSNDVEREQAEYLDLNVAYSEALVYVSKYDRRSEIRLKARCPQSLTRYCDNAEHDWVCRKCRKYLQLGLDDTHIYCGCGKAPAESFKFRCCDKVNHRMEDYVPFNPQDLEVVLHSQQGVSRLLTFMFLFTSFFHQDAIF